MSAFRLCNKIDLRGLIKKKPQQRIFIRFLLKKFRLHSIILQVHFLLIKFLSRIQTKRIYEGAGKITVILAKSLKLNVGEKKFLNLCESTMPKFMRAYFSWGEKLKQKEVFYSMKRGVYLFGKNGFVFSEHGAVYAESANGDFVLDRQIPKGDISKFKCLDSKKIYTSIHFNSTLNNYYHLTIDLLPRLFSLKKYEGEVTLLLPPVGNSYAELIIRAYLKDSKHIQIKNIENRTYFIEEYLMLSVPSSPFSGFLPFEILEDMDDSLKKNVSDEKTDLKIYISRSKTKRKILDEGKLVELLVKRGFKIVTCEDLVYQEQIELFNSADIVVAPHGEGLTNLIYSNPGTRLIEIHPRDKILPYFFFLAKSRNIDYHYSLGSSLDVENNYFAGVDTVIRKVDEVIGGSNR